MDGDRIEVVELLAPPADGRDQIDLLEPLQVLRDALPRHVEVLAELSEGLAGVGAQHVEQTPARRVRDRLEDSVDVHVVTICK